MAKRVFIAGASRGLGLFLTQKYLEEGHTVYAGLRDVNAKGIVALKAKFGDKITPVTLDMIDTASVNRAAKAVGEHTDTLDVIINNAGIHGDSSFEPLETTNLDDCTAVYDLNAVGPLRVVKAFLPFISGDTFSNVINISTESASIGDCQRHKEFDYCMSKAALNMGVKLLQNYLRDRNVKVTAIQPGWMRTDMGGPDAHLDPYENACKLYGLFESFACTDGTLFVDNDGKELPW